MPRKYAAPVLHAHNLPAWQYAVLAARGADARVVYTQHGPNPHHAGMKDRFRGKWLARRTDTLVGVSEDTARIMAERLGVEREKVEVVWNGVGENFQFPISNFQCPSKVREQLEIGKDAFVVGSVGRFSPEKNYPLLVRAFAKLPGETKLLLVGDGPERKNIEGEIERCGVKERAILTGMVDDAVSYTQAMDVFCLSSDSEGVSRSLLEAGVCGVPAVVTNAGGNVEVVEHEVTGLVVAAGDESALTNALGRMMADECQNEMGDKARKRVQERFSLSATLDAYEAIYEQV